MGRGHLSDRILPQRSRLPRPRQARGEASGDLGAAQADGKPAQGRCVQHRQVGVSPRADAGGGSQRGGVRGGGGGCGWKRGWRAQPRPVSGSGQRLLEGSGGSGQRAGRLQQVQGHSQPFSALSLGSVRTLFPAPEDSTKVFQDTWQVCPCNVVVMDVLQVLQTRLIQTDTRFHSCVPTSNEWNHHPQLSNPELSSLFLTSHIPSSAESF